MIPSSLLSGPRSRRPLPSSAPVYQCLRAPSLCSSPACFRAALAPTAATPPRRPRSGPVSERGLRQPRRGLRAQEIRMRVRWPWSQATFRWATSPRRRMCRSSTMARWAVGRFRPFHALTSPGLTTGLCKRRWRWACCAYCTTPHLATTVVCPAGGAAARVQFAARTHTKSIN